MKLQQTLSMNKSNITAARALYQLRRGKIYRKISG